MTDLSVLMDRYKNKMGTVAWKSAIDLGNRVKEGTPKKTGRARGSWSDNGGLVVGKDYIYSSSLDYMPALEYGKKGVSYDDGREAHSPQAPHGMVRINVVKWPEIVKKYAKAS